MVWILQVNHEKNKQKKATSEEAAFDLCC